MTENCRGRMCGSYHCGFPFVETWKEQQYLGVTASFQVEGCTGIEQIGNM